jgi:hypothetical protein
MTAYPMICEAEKLDTVGKVAFLNHVIAVSPWNESAWIELSKLASDFAKDDKNKPKLRASLDAMYLHFAHFPDFTWTIFNDMVAFEEGPKERIAHYVKLQNLYIAAKRPDLASQVVLKLCGILEENDMRADALRVLSEMCLVFPNEGRFIPPLIQRMNENYQLLGGKGQELVVFYGKFLPSIDTKRGNTVSEYCVQMHEEGIKAARQFQLPALEVFCTARLQQINASGKPPP